MVKKVRAAWLHEDHPYLHVLCDHALKYLTAQPRVCVKPRTNSNGVTRWENMP